MCIIETSDGFSIHDEFGRLNTTTGGRAVGLKSGTFFKKSEGWTRELLEDLIYRRMY